jgi:hypothetical protein
MTGSTWAQVTTGDTTAVTYPSGWVITYDVGDSRAEIHSPDGELVGVRVVWWPWYEAVIGGWSSPSIPCDYPPPVPAEKLAAVLAEWVKSNAEGLGLPPL